MAASSIRFFLLLLLPFFLSFLPLSTQQNLTSFSINDSPWRPDQKDRILVSPNSTFAAGFRPVPAKPQSFVFSIWFQKAANRTIVWSLNGDDPVNRSSPLTINAAGALQLVGSSGQNLWPLKAAGRPNASRLVLREDGSLVFDGWTSFDIPTDTLLPNQPFLRNDKTLTSRRYENSYAGGNFSFQNATTLFFGTSDDYWNASDSSPLKNLTRDGVIINENQATMVASDVGSFVSRRLTLDIDGNLRLYSLDPSLGSWKVVWQAVQELCTIHGSCGPNYICTNNGSNTNACICPAGFHVTANGSCDRNIQLSADPSRSRFLRMDFVKFDIGAEVQAPNMATCQARCLNSSGCRGFAAKFDGKQYCALYLDRLVNGYWSPGGETASFIRVDRSEREESNFTGMTTLLETVCPVNISLPFPPKESNTERRNLAIICSLFAIELISGVLSFWAFLRRYSKYRDMARTFGLEFLPAGGPKRFSYAELKSATKDFSQVLGQGGFGVVYRGELPDHRVVAVKRLKNVASGEAEFWAEVTIIARMHHLNLVRMWGFCAEKGQRMLVYEYIPNGSLDKFLFPPSYRPSEENSGDSNGRPPKRPILDWNIRYRIAVGVARAIAYLHEECLEWVLHCDIKPENILLEDDFCPKVSDFGLAKLAKKEDKVSMSRIRGTRGYLAPEWIRQGEPITAKADVYSFGMVLLEIVSGIRNFNFQRSSVESEDWYFPRWAFEKVYLERRVEEILDQRIIDSYDGRAHFAMVDRMVKTAMWCLQDRPEMRPSMGKVAKMLEGTVEITEPEKPTIFYLNEE